MLDLGWPELLIILVIIVLIFGPGRLSKAMGEVGKGIRSFRDTFNTNSSDDKSDSVSDTNAEPK